MLISYRWRLSQTPMSATPESKTRCYKKSNYRRKKHNKWIDKTNASKLSDKKSVIWTDNEKVAAKKKINDTKQNLFVMLFQRSPIADSVNLDTFLNSNTSKSRIKMCFTFILFDYVKSTHDCGVLSDRYTQKRMATIVSITFKKAFILCSHTICRLSFIIQKRDYLTLLKYVRLGFG